tara:strand:+ start:400 stop:945 length:546 start_codon:yes stop_codon:yes gene_type:complete
MTWKPEVNKLVHIAHYSTQINLNRKFAYNIVDRALRAASDILSAESLNVVNNTASVIQWCRQWSDQALHEYWTIRDELTETRNGKPPTHRQICNYRDINRKRPFTVEHEYPILIPKKGILDDGWTEDQLRVWMYKYGRATIITQAENARLLNHTADMQIAAKRYDNASITICDHPHFGDDK